MESEEEEDEEFRELGVGDRDDLEKFAKEASMMYFGERGLVSHQIDSYNDFVKNGLQRVFDSFQELVVEPGHDPSKKTEGELRYASVRFGNVTLESPIFWAGTDKEIKREFLPRNARLQNMTYAAAMKVDITVEVTTDFV